MATNTIRIDNGVKEETARIAAELGLTFNSVVNILLRKFNAEGGFPFPVKIEERKTSVFDMSSAEFEAACQKAVADRAPYPVAPQVTYLDDETGRLITKDADGREEYVSN